MPWRFELSTPGALLLLVLSLLVAPGADAAEATPGPLRIAVAAPLNADAPAAWRQAATDWAGLVTTELSHAPGLVVLERNQLSQLTEELSRSLAQGGGNNAVRAGQILGADLLLVGTLWRNPATNLWVLRLVDARTGIVCDTGLVPVSTEAPLVAAATAARFVQQANHEPGKTGSPRFVAVGAFEDIGLSRRYPDFAQWVRQAVEAKSAGTRIVPVERQQAGALLAELRLRLGYFLDEAATNRLEPALLVVDGVYQSTQDQEAGIDLVLRVERVGGGAKTRSLHEPVGGSLATHVAEFVAAGFTDLGATNAPAGRSAEAAIQLARGNELARLPRALNAPLLNLGGDFQTVPADRRRQNTLQAAEAFASAMALSPENAEAKLGLAICWMSPFGGRRTEGRDLLREVLASTTNRELTLTAYAQLAESYESDQPDTARKLHRRLATELSDRGGREAHLYSYCELTERLFKRGRLPESEAIIAEDALVDQACQSASDASTAGHSFDAYMLGGNTLGLLAHWRGVTEAEADGYYGGLIGRLTVRAPPLAPYFIAGLVARYDEPTPWVLRQLEALVAHCEQQPEHMSSPKGFYSESLPAILQWYAVHREDAAAARSGAVLQKRGGRLEPTLRIELAFSLHALGRQEEALALLRPIDSLQTEIGHDGPWGAARSPIKVSALLAEWQSGTAATNDAPVKLELGSPRLSLGEEFVFTVGSNRLWIGDGLIPLMFDPQGDAIRLLLHAPHFRQPIRCVAVHDESVWFGTEGDGLYEYHPADGSWSHTGVNEGLLLDHVTTLLTQPGRLWVGFGRERNGGVGYLDLKTRQWVMLTPPLPSSVTAARTAQEKAPFVGTLAQAPQGRITGLLVQGGTLLALAPDSGAHRLDLQSQSWLPVITAGGSHSVFALGATEHFILATSPFAALETIRTPTRSSRLQFMQVPDLALPSPWGICLAGTRDDQVWLGGNGYLACLDLGNSKIRTLGTFSSISADSGKPVETPIRNLQLSGDRLWVAAGRNLHEVRLPLTPPTSPRPR